MEGRGLAAGGGKGGKENRTLSKLTRMLPTLVAPTGTIEKNP